MYISNMEMNGIHHEITVTFLGGRKGIYTTDIFSLLVDDPEVMEIMDNETGEILYVKE